MNTTIYQNIATRTAGDIYIGVVGPVRTGKSTFIKRFMETQVIPNIENVYRRERARDELPQSGSGRTIMTAEPKFVPEEAAQIQLEGGAAFSVRLIDCVGYMVRGAIGQYEDDAPRMVTTPWYDHEIPMTEAAEIGTRKVIAEHSTIGVVITTDGTISDIPREDYLEAEERVIRELQELGKPFIVLLNSADPKGERAGAIARDITSRYEVNCMAVNCLELDEDAVGEILKAVLYEFPMQELDLFLPPWVDALPADHPIKAGLYEAVRQGTDQLHHIREINGVIASLGECENISEAKITSIDLGTGIAAATLVLPRELFYHTLSEQSGFSVADDGDLAARAAERLLAGAYERARARIPEQCAEIERAMAAIRAIEGAERNNTPALSDSTETACVSPLSADATDTALAFDPDAAAREFGRMLGRLFAHNQGFWTEAMEELGRGLGRFIYLMDAAVDFNDDAASGSYNPFVTLGSDAEAMRATLSLAAADAAAPYERLPLVQDAHLMDAILYSGVWAQFNKAYPPQDALAQNEGSPQSEPPRN